MLDEVKAFTKRLMEKSANPRFKHNIHVELFLSSFDINIAPMIKMFPVRPNNTPITENNK